MRGAEPGVQAALLDLEHIAPIALAPCHPLPHQRLRCSAVLVIPWPVAALLAMALPVPVGHGTPPNCRRAEGCTGHKTSQERKQNFRGNHQILAGAPFSSWTTGGRVGAPVSKSGGLAPPPITAPTAQIGRASC